MSNSVVRERCGVEDNEVARIDNYSMVSSWKNDSTYLYRIYIDYIGDVCRD